MHGAPPGTGAHRACTERNSLCKDTVVGKGLIPSQRGETWGYCGDGARGRDSEDRDGEERKNPGVKGS